MHIDISVVVPVYNAEKYLKKCIETLLSQTLKSIELIFVDDGSTDHSIEIIEEYQKKDSRITLIKQKNQYAGVARNNGMKLATGKYIIFLDSDDFFKPTMLKRAFCCAEKAQADITIFNYCTFDNITRKTEKIRYAHFPKKPFTVETIGERFFDYYYTAPWNKLFLRSFIEKKELKFQSIKKSNDAYFTLTAAFLAKKIIYIKERFVYYRINNYNSLQGNSNNYRTSVIESEKAVKAKLKELNIFYGVKKKAYNRHLIRMLHIFGRPDSAELESLKEYYHVLKKELVPSLFDSTEDFKDDLLLTQIYAGEPMESIMLNQMSQMVLKTSKEYRIGQKVLVLAKTLYQWLP